MNSSLLLENATAESRNSHEKCSGELTITLNFRVVHRRIIIFYALPRQNPTHSHLPDGN